MSGPKAATDLTPETSEAPPAEKNIRAVVDLDREARRAVSAMDRLTELISAAAGSTGFVLFHVAWFTLWAVANTRRAHPFDPYPFNLLTMTVSLEAILLTSFVLMAQNRMTRAADTRANLDLQVNLLAEQELTAILKVVCMIADKTGIDVRECDPNLDRLLGRTDVKALNEQINREMAPEAQGPQNRH
jgi:uncharacterized membrane protein